MQSPPKHSHSPDLAGSSKQHGDARFSRLDIPALLLIALTWSAFVAYATGGGNHATTLLLQWQVVGVDPDFAHDTALILTGQTAGPFPAAATINFRVRASNSAGTIDSAAQTITLT